MDNQIDVSMNDQIDISINDLIDVYFIYDISDNPKYDDLFLPKIQKAFKRNLINFLNDFIYYVSYDNFNTLYKRYFNNESDQYKNFLVTSAIKNINRLSNQKYIREAFYPILKKKICVNDNTNIIYDIYNIAYISVYNYFYVDSDKVILQNYDLSYPTSSPHCCIVLRGACPIHFYNNPVGETDNGLSRRIYLSHFFTEMIRT